MPLTWHSFFLLAVPSPPTNVTAIAVSPYRIDLTWSPSENFNGPSVSYEVFWKVKSASINTFSAIYSECGSRSDSSNFSMVISTTEAGQEHYITVSSILTRLCAFSSLKAQFLSKRQKFLTQNIRDDCSDFCELFSGQGSIVELPIAQRQRRSDNHSFSTPEQPDIGGQFFHVSLIVMEISGRQFHSKLQSGVSRSKNTSICFSFFTV